MLDCDAVELGACHLALAPAGEGLVLSWRQDLQAVLEPSERRTSTQHATEADATEVLTTHSTLCQDACTNLVLV